MDITFVLFFFSNTSLQMEKNSHDVQKQRVYLQCKTFFDFLNNPSNKRIFEKTILEKSTTNAYRRDFPTVFLR